MCVKNLYNDDDDDNNNNKECFKLLKFW